MIKANDWRKERMAQIRKLIRKSDPDIYEEQKYKMPSNPGGIPVWYNNGMICTGETYNKHLRFTFPKAKELKKFDTCGLLNKQSAIVIKETDELNETAFKNLIKAAVKINKEKNKMKSISKLARSITFC